MGECHLARPENMSLWLFSSFLQLLGLAVLLIILLATYKFLFRQKGVGGLQRPDWERDVVYLCQFPLCPSVRSISPFALKLETWLRVNKIKYENIFSMKFHPKTGLIPYIELNGESFSDSNLIIEKLKKKFALAPVDPGLTKEQLAMSHAATSMVENFWARFQPFATKLRNHFSGLGREENSTVWHLASRGLAALSAWLGEKEYFHGGSTPSTIDCVIFGHLAQFLYIDIGFPQRTFLESECRNLVDLVTRMKDKYWADWDQSIEASKESMM